MKINENDKTITLSQYDLNKIVSYWYAWRREIKRETGIDNMFQAIEKLDSFEQAPCYSVMENLGTRLEDVNSHFKIGSALLWQDYEITKK